MSHVRLLTSSRSTSTVKDGTASTTAYPLEAVSLVTPDGSPIIASAEDNIVNDFLVDDVANHHMNIDGSIVPKMFSAGPGSANEVWHIECLILTLADTNLAWNEFGGLGAALTNGILIGAGSAEVFYFDFLNDDPAKANGELIEHAGGSSRQDFPGAGPTATNGLIFEINWRNRFSRPLILEGNSGLLENMYVYVQDNLTGLTSLTAKLFGWKYATA